LPAQRRHLLGVALLLPLQLGPLSLPPGLVRNTNEAVEIMMRCFSTQPLAQLLMKRKQMQVNQQEHMAAWRGAVHVSKCVPI
jgi:hypothetical protein